MKSCQNCRCVNRNFWFCVKSVVRLIVCVQGHHKYSCCLLVMQCIITVMAICGEEEHFFGTNAFTLRTVIPGDVDSSDDKVNT